MAEPRRLLPALALVLAGPAMAYSTLGLDWSWEDRAVSEDFLLNASSFPTTTGSTAELEEALEGALELWTDEGTAQVATVSGGSTSSSTPARDTENLLSWASSTSGSSTLAQATIWYTGGSRIVDCDIEFYGQNGSGSVSWSADSDGAPAGEYDLERVAIHEVGHCLGLDHSADSEAVMYASVQDGTDASERALAQDDVDGLVAIYGEAAPRPLVDALLVDDGAGDGDGIPDLGEAGTLELTVWNAGYVEATELVFTVVSDASELTVDGAEVEVGDLASDATQEVVGPAFEVDPACVADFGATLTVAFEDALGEAWTEELSLEVHCTADEDGDGYTVTTDCDDGDPAVNPGATEVWYDGTDSDCDGWSDYDADLDGFDSDAYGGLDCDDALAEVNPDGAETCNGLDDDCDGTVDDPSASDDQEWWADADGDGFGDEDALTEACEQPAGAVAAGGEADCDDDRAEAFPGAPEWCNGLDDDCDGEADEDAGDTVSWYQDADGDTFGTTRESVVACEAPAGFVAGREEGVDCDDTDGEVFPGAVEVCDGVDQDCDGRVDQEAVDALPLFVDGDGDGHGALAQAACEVEPGLVEVGGDCDDADAEVFPGADEVCDGVDQDCDEVVDEDPVDGSTWYADGDGDGFGDPDHSTDGCWPGEGWRAEAGDCDDTDPAAFPGSPDRDCSVAEEPEGGGLKGPIEPEGCACASAGSARGMLWLWMAPVLTALRVRRSARNSPVEESR